PWLQVPEKDRLVFAPSNDDPDLLAANDQGVLSAGPLLNGMILLKSAAARPRRFFIVKVTNFDCFNGDYV
ncbi:MAG: hypothetical protein ACM37Z_08065, partial [Deltaproteobacteria bacterium]